ncbi:MAG: serine/threonine protein kinase, partial [Mycobacterium sp.]|nr:serine/threonine protein kinase [Mycobacterium sp.]
DGVFAKALARRPADRFESCREFADAVNEQANGLRAEPGPAGAPAEEYRAYIWPETDDAHRAEPRRLQAAAALARRLGDPSGGQSAPVPPVAPKPRRPRRAVLWSAAAVLLAGLLALGIVVWRRAQPIPGQAPAGAPTTTTTVGATAPVPLDGTYSLDAQRSRQTFNRIADPQPPDATTWWAFRSSCTSDSCTAGATQLDDSDHTRAISPGGSLFLQFGDGHWRSAPEGIRFPCIGPDGVHRTEAATLVLTLAPQPQGDFAGEETFTVRTDECGQRSAVIRIPTVARRSGAAPPGVSVPDPTDPRTQSPPLPPTTHR